MVLHTLFVSELFIVTLFLNKLELISLHVSIAI